MRGEIWSFAPPGRGPESLVLAVVQSDALGDAPTLVGLAVTTRPQSAGPPLTVALEPASSGLQRPVWIKVTQVHTMAVADARDRVGRVPAETLAEVDAALAEVLGFGRVRDESPSV